MTIAAPLSTLVQIQKKVRNITSRPDVSQLTDDDLNQAIQTFYVYDFPEHLRLYNLKETYTFTTQEGIDAYDFDRNKYISVQPPLYIDGYESFWAQSREEFYRVWPKIEFQFTAGQGNGTSGPYTFQIAEKPVLRAQKRFNRTFDSDIIVCANDSSGNTMNLIDDGGLLDNSAPNLGQTGRLIDAIYSKDIPPLDLLDPTLNRGTVNYQTGSFTFTFPLSVAGSEFIRISSIPYTRGRPTSCLFFDDKFVVRPVPNTCYKISIDAWKNPLQFLEQNNNPELNEWWQCIALGASLKIFEDQGEIDEYAKFLPIFEKYKLLVQRRTIVQQTNQRTPTIYANQFTYGSYQNFFGRRF